MSQSTLPVRSSDPETSYAALGASRIRPIVLDIVREKGPLTHDELIAAYDDRVVTSLGEVPRASDSGVRTRLKELAHQGLVTAADADGFPTYGNAAKRWIAVDPDDPSFVYDPDAIAAYIDDEDIVGFGHFLDGDASDASGTDED
ncbi:hypothetical protein ACFVVC_02035 [Pseudarthrobacter sp. NPDC058196]|uniref:hypothetical protein n=1 Tax=Pseudarthrobacter sp. NPDC058196 TaxID=3346376 RepID=UPI0036D8C9DB